MRWLIADGVTRSRSAAARAPSPCGQSSPARPPRESPEPRPPGFRSAWSRATFRHTLGVPTERSCSIPLLAYRRPPCRRLMPRRTRRGCTTAVRTTEDDGPRPAPCRGVGGLRRHPALGIGRGPCVSTGVPRSVSRVLVSGLVSTILGAVSNAQNLGPLSAVGVGAYIALAGLWASPVSGASMNPARSLGPALASGDLHQLWIYLTAPPVGMLIAVAAAHILRGPGGGPHGTRAAQGNLGRSTGGSRAGAAECRCRPCRFSVIGWVSGQHRRWRSYAHTE